MEDYNALMKLRGEKAEAFRQLGHNPYANGFRPSHSLAEIARTNEELETPPEDVRYRIAGRIMAVRSFGKAAFLKLRDRSGDLQVMVRKDIIGETDFENVFKRLDVGDIIGAAGPAFRTRTGELTIQTEQLRLLTKAIRPLPEKWHGLTDVETRFRQRYVDLIVNPDVRDIFRTRAGVIQYIRRFFDTRDYLEVETPMMHPIAGGATARPFNTWHNALGMPLYLRIAPELYLKRLVVGGLERVYEINRNFRNEGISQTHNPEFTMIEFYEAYATFEDLMDLTEELITGLIETLTGGLTLPWLDEELSFARPWRRVSVRDALIEEGGLSATDADSLDALTRAVESAGAPVPEERTLGTLRMAAFEALAEHKLRHPTFLTHFPVEVSPLSRRNDDTPEIVDRFELFVAGNEIANGFSELNDPVDQRRRFEDQLALREKGDEEAHQMDRDYVRALEFGLPPTAGEGIGIDRLVMLLTNRQSIREVILFPHMRPETGGRSGGAPAGDEDEER